MSEDNKFLALVFGSMFGIGTALGIFILVI